jgi:pyruvate formate lyase activating enzyme
MAKAIAKKLDNNFVQCLACRRYCKIAPGMAGHCGVRVNEGGELKLTVHSRPVALWTDPIEKKPLFHFLPGSSSFSIGTLGCNFSCSFCQNWDISQAPHEARHKDPKHWREYFQKLVERCEKWSPERIVEEAKQSRCKSIAFTYNEPTIFTEYALDCMELAEKEGIKGVYITNGYESTECWDAMKGKIHAANIDLKAYNEKFYKELCKAPHFEYVKESIEYAKKLGIWVEVTTLLIPGWNDKLEELKAEAEWLASVDLQMPWHITAFHPDYKMLDTPGTPPEILIKARQIGQDAGLKHVYCGNLPISYADKETTSCPKCSEQLIVREGMSVKKNLIDNGKCSFCGEPIAGVWE